MSHFEDSLHEYVDSKRGEIISFLRTLVQVPSITGTVAEGRAQEIVIEKLREIDGIQLDVFEPEPDLLEKYPLHPIRLESWSYRGRPNVVGLLRGCGNGRSMILNGHIDVVSPEPLSDWTRHPWAGQIEDSRLYGRGTLDQKGGIVSMVYALKCICELGLKLDGDVLFESVVEEELGGGGTIATILKGYRADAAIVTDCFSGKDNILIGQGGSRFFRITVKGKTTVASKQDEAINAIGLASKIYDALVGLEKTRMLRVRGTDSSFAKQMIDGNKQSTTLTVGTMRAGDWPSHAAGFAQIEGRIGFPPSERGKDIERELEQVIMKMAHDDPWMRNHMPKVEWFGARREGFVVDVNEPIVKTIKNCVERITCAECGVHTTPVNSDASWLTPKIGNYGGISAIMYGPGGENAHAADEYVLVDDVIAVTKVIALCLAEWCGCH